MSVLLLTEHHLELLSLKGGCTGSSVSTFVKMKHCWKSHSNWFDESGVQAETINNKIGLIGWLFYSTYWVIRHLLNLIKKYHFFPSKNIRVSGSLNSGKVLHFVGLQQGPNCRCLQKLISADDASKQIVNTNNELCKSFV